MKGIWWFRSFCVCAMICVSAMLTFIILDHFDPRGADCAFEMMLSSAAGMLFTYFGFLRRVR